MDHKLLTGTLAALLLVIFCMPAARMIVLALTSDAFTEHAEGLKEIVPVAEDGLFKGGVALDILLALFGLPHLTRRLPKDAERRLRLLQAGNWALLFAAVAAYSICFHLALWYQVRIDQDDVGLARALRDSFAGSFGTLLLILSGVLGVKIRQGGDA